MAKKKKDDPLAGIPEELRWYCHRHRLPSHFTYRGIEYGTVGHWQGLGIAVNVHLLRDAGAKPLCLRRMWSAYTTKLEDVPYFKAGDIRQFEINDLMYQATREVGAIQMNVKSGKIRTVADYQKACDRIKATSWSVEQASAILGRYGLEVHHTQWLPARELGEVAVLEEVLGNFCQHYEERHIHIRNPSKFFFAALNDEDLKAKLLVDAL